jgi:hypothetical protein
LEEKLSQANKFHEKITELENSASFLNQADIENIQEKTSQKVQAAISLNTTLEELKRDPGFLSKAEVDRMTILKESLLSVCNVQIKIP